MGQLTLLDPHRVKWRAENGAETTLSFDGDASYLNYATDSAHRLAIVVSDDASEVYALDATRDARFRLEQRLHRFDDSVGGLRDVRLKGPAACRPDSIARVTKLRRRPPMAAPTGLSARF